MILEEAFTFERFDSFKLFSSQEEPQYLDAPVEIHEARKRRIRNRIAIVGAVFFLFCVAIGVTYSVASAKAVIDDTPENTQAALPTVELPSPVASSTTPSAQSFSLNNGSGGNTVNFSFGNTLYSTGGMDQFFRKPTCTAVTAAGPRATTITPQQILSRQLTPCPDCKPPFASSGGYISMGGGFYSGTAPMPPGVLSSSSHVSEYSGPTMVYIAPNSGSNKYHSTPNCRGLNNANIVIPIPEQHAGIQGFVKCSICGR